VSVFEGTQRVVEELGLLFSGISLHVFDRRIWSLIAQADRDNVLGGHGMFAHAVVLVQMARVSPRWLWCPDPLIRYRQAPGKVNASDWCSRYLSDLSRALRQELDEIAFRKVFERQVRSICTPVGILGLRRPGEHGWREQLMLSRLLLGRLRWLDGFWSEIVPALFIPRFAARSLRAAEVAVGAAMRMYGRILRRSPLRARLSVPVPRTLTADRIEPVRVTIDNAGLPLKTWWPILPLYVSYRWRAEDSGVETAALQPIRISRTIGRGRSGTISLRVPTPPQPGPHSLTVGLTWAGRWLDELDPRLACSRVVELVPARLAMVARAPA
jgi:hypothetical protein